MHTNEIDIEPIDNLFVSMLMVSQQQQQKSITTFYIGFYTIYICMDAPADVIRRTFAFIFWSIFFFIIFFAVDGIAVAICIFISLASFFVVAAFLSSMSHISYEKKAVALRSLKSSHVLSWQKISHKYYLIDMNRASECIVWLLYKIINGLGIEKRKARHWLLLIRDEKMLSWFHWDLSALSAQLPAQICFNNIVH